MVKTATVAVLGFAVGAGAAAGLYTAMDTAHLRPARQAQAVSTLPLGPDTISGMVARTSPAVVKVIATVPRQEASAASQYFNPFFGSIFGEGGGSASGIAVATEIGSGFFFNSQGYLLTNDHVVQGATAVKVDVPGYRQPVKAVVVGTDYASDLAVLKVHLGHLVPVLEFGNSASTLVGSWAVAIGSPYNLNHTVTVGVISAKGRPLAIGSRQYRDLLQTSAAINPGNSGGPLLNLAGQVVGINTAVESQAQGIGFAIPTSTVEKALPQLMKARSATDPWIGIYAAADNANTAKQYGVTPAHGVLVIEVDPESPAAQAGISAGDVIVRANGTELDGASALQRLVKSAAVGSVMQLTVTSHGVLHKVFVTIAENPNAPQRSA